MSDELLVKATASATTSMFGAMEAQPQETMEQRRNGWLEERRKAIGGTDVAAILGLSKWSSPMQVWLNKRGMTEASDNPQMAWGRRLERPILEGYADHVGHPITFANPYEFLKSPVVKVLGASLDARWADGDQRPVDAKNIRWKNQQDFGEAGSDIIPIYYACQLAVQMHVTDTPTADLAVLFSGQQLEVFTLYRDMEVESMILEKVEAWWERHIVQGIPPEVDGSKATTEYLTRRFQKNSDLILPATPEALEAAKRLAEVRARAKEVETEQARLENILKGIIGESAGIAGVCTWKKAQDSSSTDWKAVAAELGATPEIVRKFTTTKTGSRRFLFNFKEAE
jgi:putative phage-type endonuclease